MSPNVVGPNLIRVDAGDPVVFLAVVHVGCFEVVGSERVQRIRDLAFPQRTEEAVERLACRARRA